MSDRFRGKCLWPVLLLAIIGAFVACYWGLFTGSQGFTHDSFFWFGSFDFYVNNLARGCFPLWDPYLLTGTPSYPNLPILGLLDPLVWFFVVAVKVFGATTFEAYTYFHLSQLGLFVVGAYFLFRQVCGNQRVALFIAGVLLFAVAPSTFRQNGVLEAVFLTPLSNLLLIRIIDGTSERRRLDMVCLSLVVGISLNVYIPAYFLSNLFLFSLLLVIGRVRQRRTKSFAIDRRLLIFSAWLGLLMFLMAMPPAELFRESRSADGEHFPAIRIIQSGDPLISGGMFKDIIASDMHNDMFSSGFTGGRGVYGGIGNVLQLVSPELWRCYFHAFRGYVLVRSWCSDFISEAFLYVGLIPLCLAMIGLFFARGRYGGIAAIMLSIVGLNMISFGGVHHQLPNALQRFFTAIFPPLKAVHVWEILSGFFVLYLCLLASLGFAALLDVKSSGEFLRKRFSGTMAFVVGLMVANIAVRTCVFFDGAAPSGTSSWAIAILVSFGLLLVAHRRGWIRPGLLYGGIIFIVGVDLVSYNIDMRPFVIEKNMLPKAVAEQQEHSLDSNAFELFRIPFIRLHPLAFSESIFKRKGAMSKGNNHHFLTTKRFYDYFTHVPLDRQVVLSSLAVPMLQFFPADQVVVLPDRREVLRRLAADTPEEVADRLYLEAGEVKTLLQEQGHLDSLDRIEGLPALRREAIEQSVEAYFSNHTEEIQRLRERGLGRIQGENVQVHVEAFSTNDLSLSVAVATEGYLLYSDGWSKYWRAFDGDREIPIRHANYNFKAVWLDRGRHELRFVYEPRPMMAAILLYYLGLFGVLATIAVIAVRDRCARG